MGPMVVMYSWAQKVGISPCTNSYLVADRVKWTIFIFIHHQTRRPPQEPAIQQVNFKHGTDHQWKQQMRYKCSFSSSAALPHSEWLTSDCAFHIVCNLIVRLIITSELQMAASTIGTFDIICISIDAFGLCQSYKSVLDSWVKVIFVDEFHLALTEMFSSWQVVAVISSLWIQRLFSYQQWQI